MKICAVCDRCFDDGEMACHGELIVGRHSIDTVPGYSIERVIRSSQDTTLYQARSDEYGRECLITIVDGDTRQFLAEAAAASHLFNAGIAAVIESGRLADTSAFAVSEAFATDSLRSLFAGTSLSLLDQIRIARHAAEALQTLHAGGLLHGAIRPENISFGGIGTDEIAVKLHNIDLGSICANAVLSNRFTMDLGLDVIRYFAPERFGGQNEVASDVYSLGLVLYELLSGHPPFDGSSASELIDKHVNQRPPEIKIENFDLRMLLTHTLTESLQKKPAFRQSTADLFARQLRHIEQLATHVSTPPPAVVFAMPATSAAASLVRLEHREIPEPTFVAQQKIFIVDDDPDSRSIPVAPITTAALTEDPEPVAEAVPSQPPIVFVPPTFRRSRLKGMKRRLHSHISEARAAIIPTPTLIEWHQPENDVPSVADVKVELQKPGNGVSFDGDEEITHVRPVQRVEVYWSKPSKEHRSQLAAEFFPALFERDQRSDSGPASMFAGYQNQGRGVGRMPVYGVAMLAFVLVGFGIFRLGSALTDDSEGYIGENRPAPIVAQPSERQSAPIVPRTAVADIPARPISMPDRINPKTAVGTQDSPDKNAERSRPNSENSQKRSKTDKSEVIQIRRVSATEAPIVPSTLVITRSAGQPKTKVVTDMPSRTVTPARTGSGASRPRIVSVQN